FAVQGGSFTYVSDQTAVTTIPTIDASTTLANLGLSSVSYGGSSGARTLGGLTITGKIDAALKGLGVNYSNASVTINGVTTTPASEASKLTYIEGRSILVSGTASSFSGALTLVSTGGYDTPTNIPIGITVNITAGIVIGTNLTVGATSDGTSHLTLIRNGSPLQGDGIAIVSATVKAGGNISLIQNDTINGAEGIALVAKGTTATTGVVLEAGSSNHWVTFKTNGYKLSLTHNNNFSVTKGQLRLDLGTGGITSASGTIPSGGYVLNTSGLNVYFTGATTGNSAEFALGTGSFTFVTDLRANDTTAIGNTALTLASFTAGATSGLTLSGAGAATVKTGIVGQAMTIAALTSGANQSLSYIEGNSVTLSGAASFFTGDLLLRVTGTVTLGANLTTVGAATILASGMSLTSAVTLDPGAGAAVAINLGWGLYNNGTGTGYSLSTANRNLSITAGSIANTTPTNAIFSIGSTGVLTLGGGLALATKTRSTGTPTYTSSYITSATEEATFNGAGAVYYFTSLTGAALTTAKLAVTDTNAVWLDAAALTAANLGSKSVPSYNDSFTVSGLSERTSGDYFWGTAGGIYSEPTATVSTFTLKDSRGVHFFGLTATSSTMPATTPSWLSSSTSLTFDGVNSFSNGLSLTSAGAITQATGATLS
ncbi:MAG: hypothetical protein ORO03_00165, partial [Alphaproteobacteria bacterium]|nr:hypothetical protein [Alphaproteobacteria bacterium]